MYNDESTNDGERPSFTQFWKRSKEQNTARNITFVQSGPPGAGPSDSDSKAKGTSGSGIGNVDPEEAAKEKAQIRRAQVRKAQIQHRQRKANYIKQLEQDIVQIREMITEAERQSKQLKNENAFMRKKLTLATTNLAGGAIMYPGQKQQSLSPTGVDFTSGRSLSDSPVFSPDMQLPPAASTTSFFSDPSLDNVSVSLRMDDAMNYPCLQFARNSSPGASGPGDASSAPSPPKAETGSPSAQTLTGIPGIDLTPEQTDQAINFILALEHVCWGHFHAADFKPEMSSGRPSAHTLMASSIALSTAPQQVFKQLGKTQRNLWFTPSALQSNPISGDINWNSTGLSLHSLHGLATSLNPGDKEITPVQAWFELAQGFDIDLLLNPAVIDHLKRGFHGVVKCAHYGATMERGAFESVVGRVIGAALGVDETDYAYLSGIGSTDYTGDEFGMTGRTPSHQIGMAIAGPSG